MVGPASPIKAGTSANAAKVSMATLGTKHRSNPMSSNWIKCTDRMPEQRQDFLVSDGAYVGVGRWYESHDECGFIFNMGDSYIEITHWMPLPELPKDGE